MFDPSIARPTYAVPLCRDQRLAMLCPHPSPLPKGEGAGQLRVSWRRTLSTKWMTWNELPWVARGETGTAVQLCDRLIQAALKQDSVTGYLQAGLPELTTEFPAQWVGVWKRTPQWELVAEHGRHTWPQPPLRFFDDILEREAGGCWPSVFEFDGWTLIGLPLPASPDGQPRVLVLAGRRLTADELPIILAVGRVLGYGLSLSERMSRYARRADKLRNTLAVAATFAGAPDTTTLLEATRTRRRSCSIATAPAFLFGIANGTRSWPARALGVKGGSSAHSRQRRHRRPSHPRGKLDSRGRCLRRQPLQQDRR